MSRLITIFSTCLLSLSSMLYCTHSIAADKISSKKNITIAQVNTDNTAPSITNAIEKESSLSDKNSESKQDTKLGQAGGQAGGQTAAQNPSQTETEIKTSSKAETKTKTNTNTKQKKSDDFYNIESDNYHRHDPNADSAPVINQTNYSGPRDRPGF